MKTVSGALGLVAKFQIDCREKPEGEKAVGSGGPGKFGCELD